MTPETYAWRERARLALELLCGCGPFDEQDRRYVLRERAYVAVQRLVVELEKEVEEQACLK